MAGDPFALHAEITTPDGETFRWDPSAADPGNRPQAVSFSTRRFHGFHTAGCGLPRRVDRDSRDTQLFNLVRLVSGTGETAWEGRISKAPRSLGDTHETSVEAVGLMASAQDVKFSMIFADRDVTAWKPMPFPRKAFLAANGRSTSDLNWSVDAGGAYMDVPTGNAIGEIRTVAELWYVAPTGCTVQAFAYQGSNAGPMGGWTSKFYTTNVLEGDSFTDLGSGALDGVLHTTNVGSPTRAVFFQVDTNGVANTPTVGTNQQFSALAAYGNHSVPGRDIPGEPQGVYMSDVIRWLIGLCPDLNDRAVQTTNKAIGHMVFRDRTTPYDAMLVANGPHWWELNAWEGGTVHYHPVDLSEPDWVIRQSDLGMTLEDQGPSIEDLANEIEVTYTDVADGDTKTLLPADYPVLRDDSVTNRVNRAYRRRTAQWTLPGVALEQDALAWGAAKLAELNIPYRPGSCAIRGLVRDVNGNQHPCWKVRAGDRVLLADNPDEPIVLVKETSYRQAELVNTLVFEGEPSRLDALMERIVGVLASNGLA